MAFTNRRSWRLKFIDIDSSFTMTVADNPLIGYIVARAPKGNVRPTYFPQGNGKAIDALMGLGSSNWPDLLEAKSYNDEYPLYISAPPGTSSVYPSFLGGFYVTKNGLYKFHNVSDKQQLEDGVGMAFKVGVDPGREDQFNADFADRKTRIIIQAPEFTQLEGENEFTDGQFTFKLAENAALILTKDRRLNVTDIDYRTMRNGLVSPVGSTLTGWGDNDGLWEFAGQSAILTDFGHPASADVIPLERWIGTDNYEALVIGSGTREAPVPNMEALMELFQNGFVTVDDEIFEISMGLQNMIDLIVSIQEDTYCYFMQKSPTEIPTTVKLSMIGYDKYRYDQVFAYAPYNVSAYNSSKRLVIQWSGAGNNEVMLDHEFVALYDPASPAKVKFIGQLAEDDTGYFYEDVTNMFITQYFTMQVAITGQVNDALRHRFFFVDSDEIIQVLTEEEMIAKYGIEEGPGAYKVGLADGTAIPGNPLFNALTVSSAEEVYAGTMTSGGEFTGSLDELGTDTFGSGIFFPEILSDDDMSFIEVRVLKKFGDDPEDLDETGFWRHRRIVDPLDMDLDGNKINERSFNIEGSRYASLVMTMNLVQQRTGGIWRPEWTSIIRDGLIEARLPEYDDAYIFMEPTGQETFKTDLRNISQDQELAVVISPKILRPNNRGVITAAIAQKELVNGRISQRSNAQYAGEFEVRDPTTFKTYWRQPIGDIACNLVRIIERRYGGWAPAWYNIAGDLGGQLKGTVLRSRYQFEDEATKILDDKGINPISFTSDDGLMILSQKTTQNPTFKSDWSFLGHSMSFQLCKREIRDNVMRPQIMKPINEYWMSMRQNQIENILSRRTGGSSPIWSYAGVNIHNQQTQVSRSQRNFVIKVDVRVNVFSESVTLIFETLAQV